MKQLYSPNSCLVVGTLETIEGLALVNGFNDDNTPDYAGETEVIWDSQKSQTRDDEILVVDEQYEVFKISECEVRDE